MRIWGGGGDGGVGSVRTWGGGGDGGVGSVRTWGGDGGDVGVLAAAGEGVG